MPILLDYQRAHRRKKASSVKVKSVHILKYESPEDLSKNLQLVVDTVKDSSIVCIRGLSLTKADQLQLVKDLGDIFSWTPNNETAFAHEYIENHSRNDSTSNSSATEVILGWHMEHVDYDNYTPLVAGVWNMQKFTCSPDVGMTYFMDSRDVYELIFSEDEKDFLRKSKAQWSAIYPGGRKITNSANAVAKHWLDGREQLRLEMHQLSSLELSTLNDAEPTLQEKNIFQDLVAKFISEVFNNEDLRIVHKWNQGDILIPDLYALAHAVTGGFSPDEREFTGFWCYREIPEDQIPGDTVHSSW
jgi:alpha-ketoglutarate-dependent taurine dioxygenase